MSLAEFIRDHTDEINEYILVAIGRKTLPHDTDEERESWLLNDEFLHIWARSEGVIFD